MTVAVRKLGFETSEVAKLRSITLAGVTIVAGRAVKAAEQRLVKQFIRG